jgi:DNA-binding MarR family transcriptional regulator
MWAPLLGADDGDAVTYADLSQPVVSQTIEQLEANGRAARAVDVIDTRSRRLAATPNGERLFAIGSDELRAVETDLNQRLGSTAARRSSLDLLLGADADAKRWAGTPRTETD